jgi:glutaredoxin
MSQSFLALCHWCVHVKKKLDEIIVSFILVKQKVKMEELEEESHLQLT